MRLRQRQITLAKAGERYVFQYLPGQERVLMAILLEHASDPHSDIDWMDVAVLSFELGRTVADRETMVTL